MSVTTKSRKQEPVAMYDYQMVMKSWKRFFEPYDRLVAKWMSLTSFSAGPSILILFAAFFEIFFAYGYARGIMKGINLSFVPPLLGALSISMFVHAWLYGALDWLGMKSPFRLVKRLNRHYDGTELKTETPLKDIRKVMRDISRLPILKMITSILDVAIIFVLMFAYNYFYLDNMYGVNFALIALIVFPLHAQFTFTMTDLHLMKYRADLTHRLYSAGLFHPVYYSLSLKAKFAMITVSIALSWIIIMTLMGGEMARTGKGLVFVVIFSLYCIFLFIVLSVLYFSNIFVAVNGLQKAAEKMKRNEAFPFHTSSSDKELTTLSAVFFEAAQKVSNQKEILEKTVRERTLELELVNQELQSREAEVRQELDFASEIQAGMLPQIARPWDGIHFASYYRPMGKVSGDYFDIFRQEDCLYVMVADVSGHGIPAAFITMAAKQSFSKAFENELSPAAVLEEVNLDILNRVKTQDYLTAFVLRFDEQYRFTYANAAHHPAVHYRAKEKAFEEYDTSGYILGAIEEASHSYENKHSRMKSGDRIFLYTDGIVEQLNPEGESYGKKRFLELIRQTAELPLTESIAAIVKDFEKFTGEQNITDDITLVALELTPKWADFAKRFNAGLQLYRKKKFQEALPVFEDAASILPEYPLLHFYLAKTYARLNAFTRAAKEIEKYLITHKRNAAGLRLAARVYSHEKKFHKAFTFAKRVLEVEPNNPENEKLFRKIRQKLAQIPVKSS